MEEIVEMVFASVKESYPCRIRFPLEFVIAFVVFLLSF